MIGLSEVQASLSLFAEAIVGQPVPFVTVEDVGECWPWVAAADPHKVCLPVQLESREMYRSMLLHQLLTHDYETSQPGFHQVYALVEDHRVNAEIRRFFPGAANDLERVLKNAREREDMQGAPDALELLRLHTLGASRASVMAFAEEPKLLSIVIGLADEVTVAAATSADSVRLAAKICDLLIGFETGRSRADLLVDLEADDDEPALPTEGTTGVSVDGGPRLSSLRAMDLQEASFSAKWAIKPSVLSNPTIRNALRWVCGCPRSRQRTQRQRTGARSYTTSGTITPDNIAERGVESSKNTLSATIIRLSRTSEAGIKRCVHKFDGTCSESALKIWCASIGPSTAMSSTSMPRSRLWPIAAVVLLLMIGCRSGEIGRRVTWRQPFLLTSVRRPVRRRCLRNLNLRRLMLIPTTIRCPMGLSGVQRPRPSWFVG